MSRFDVAIIGGGPAGAALALRLAQAGCNVAVLEKSVFPRAKVCGEFIAAPGVHALHELGVALPPGEEIRRIVLWAGATQVEAQLAPARAMAREVLDTLLLERARRAGAALYQPARALEVIRTRAGAFTVLASGGIQLEARAVVAAHGSWEPGALPTQGLRTRPKPADLFGFKVHLRRHHLPAGAIALVPFAGGYAGALDLGSGTATFACSVRRDALRSLRARHPDASAGEAVFRHALEASRALQDAFAASVRDGAWLAVGPLRPGVRPLVREGIFAIGNAAAEVHPIVGEGVALALQSASALALPLLDALRRGRDPLQAHADYRRRHGALARRRLWRSAALATIAASPALAAWAREPLRRMPSLLALAARA